MEKFGKSQSVKRVEDVRFLTGQGRYVDDIAPDNALNVFFLRAPMAHGIISQLNVDDARKMPGVALIVSAQDLLDAGVNIDFGGGVVTNTDGSKGAKPVRPILAMDRVRHVGEAIVAVFAETLAQAKDAAEAIEIDFDELPVHMDVAVGGDTIHPEAPKNQAFDWDLGDAKASATTMQSAAHVVTVDVIDNRVISNPMETRACYAEMVGDRLHVAVNGQGVWGPKTALARHLGLDPDNIRVTNPDVGGGFGTKGFNYPETFVCAHATRVLGRPTKWMAERTEGMLTDNAGRDLVTTATLGFDADFKFIAYSLDTIANMGAYNSGFAQNIQTELFSKVLTGTYDVQAAHMRTRGVYTNTTPVDAYRGAGRPEAIFVLERAMDEAARQLGVDPWVLRRNSFIKPDQFPYKTATDVTYDVGDFASVLTQLGQECDREGFAARKAESAKAGKLRGMGLCYYIESILGDKSETARVEFTDDGALIFVGTQSNGQGHETVYAQFLADQSGIPADKIAVVQGDSDRIATGGGTGGSRSVTVQNTATLATVDVMVEAFGAFLADQEGVDASEVTFNHETFEITGRNLRPSMLEVADMVRTADRFDLLTHSAKITLDNRSFPNGAHVAEVEIDPDTGVVTVARYTVVDDFGNLINPMLVAGQVYGGVAQGIGQALSEHVVFDESGQLLTATFMDYGMPRADNVPVIGFTTQCTPSTYNPMGMKGCGEAGTVGALAAMANAVLDAAWDTGVRKVDMPFTPQRVWNCLQVAKDERGAA